MAPEPEWLIGGDIVDETGGMSSASRCKIEEHKLEVLREEKRMRNVSPDCCTCFALGISSFVIDSRLRGFVLRGFKFSNFPDRSFELNARHGSAIFRGSAEVETTIWNPI
jgi:hypothetical protein